MIPATLTRTDCVQGEVEGVKLYLSTGIVTRVHQRVTA